MQKKLQAPWILFQRQRPHPLKYFNKEMSKMSKKGQIRRSWSFLTHCKNGFICEHFNELIQFFNLQDEANLVIWVQKQFLTHKALITLVLFFIYRDNFKMFEVWSITPYSNYWLDEGLNRYIVYNVVRHFCFNFFTYTMKQS